jgi:plasmid maintenance system antidote protein VapI
MILETIRKHIEACGKSRYRISQDTGVDEATLCRIVAGKTCSIETADILLKYFGLTIAKKAKRKAR